MSMFLTRIASLPTPLQKIKNICLLRMDWAREGNQSQTENLSSHRHGFIEFAVISILHNFRV